MKKDKSAFATKVLSDVAQRAMKSAANSRCVFVFHQPKQPKALKKYRKF